MLAKKIGMTTVFVGNRAVPSTVVLAYPNIILQVKNPDKDGYSALKLEISISDQNTTYQKDAEVGIEQFKIGDMVDISGTSKGKGFAGVVKRHGFHRGPETHGSDHHRAPGSIGSMFPQRVFKGKKLPGQMGGERVTAKNLSVVAIDTERKTLCVKGAVPGKNGSYILIKAND